MTSTAAPDRTTPPKKITRHDIRILLNQDIKDLTGLDLTGLDLQDLDLTDVDFRGANLIGTKLPSSTAYAKNLPYAKIQGIGIPSNEICDIMEKAWEETKDLDKNPNSSRTYLNCKILLRARTTCLESEN